MVAHAFNLRPWEAQAGEFPGQQSLQSKFQDIQEYIGKLFSEKVPGRKVFQNSQIEPNLDRNSNCLPKENCHYGVHLNLEPTYLGCKMRQCGPASKNTRNYSFNRGCSVHLGIQFCIRLSSILTIQAQPGFICFISKDVRLPSAYATKTEKAPVILYPYH